MVPGLKSIHMPVSATHAFVSTWQLLDFLQAATALEVSYVAVPWKCDVPSNIRPEITTRKKNSNCT